MARTPNVTRDQVPENVKPLTMRWPLPGVLSKADRAR